MQNQHTCRADHSSDKRIIHDRYHWHTSLFQHNLERNAGKIE